MDNENLIARLSLIDDINNMEIRYRNRHSILPINISSWSSTADYESYIASLVQISDYKKLTPYIYSYDFDNEFAKDIKQKLGIPNKFGYIATANNTISIVCIANYIKQYDFKRILIINPAYFSFEKSFDAFNIPYQRTSMLKSNGEYVLPREQILQGNFDIIIITNPIFSSGSYLTKKDILFINELASKRHKIVLDESFATFGKELVRKIPNENIMHIYCPHKSLSLNSYKFSLLIFDASLQQFFDHWYDVFCGGLNQCSFNAIEHFCTENYEQLVESVNKRAKTSYLIIENLVANYSNFSCSNYESGEYVMVYSKCIHSADFSMNELENMMEATGAYFMPGTLHGYNDELSFRINLLSFNEQSCNALSVILNYINQF